MSLAYINATVDPPQNFLIHEDTQQYTKHDQLFKQLIKAFFKEFLEAFFPVIHEQVDFERITFLSEELFTGVYEGNKKILDLAVEVKWKETDTLIIVHVEPQSYQQSNFNDRMFKYFSLLYNKVEKPIIPIAVFSYEDPWEKSNFSMTFGDFEVLDFNYLTLHLRKQNWRAFIKRDNPIVAALLSKMGYTDDERVQVKLEFFKTLARLKLDREKNELLLGFFESYLKLSEEEEALFVKEASKLQNAEEILEIPISYVEKGRKEGREEGRQEGRVEGREEGLREVALNMLKDGFSIEKIAELTQMDRNDIEKLKNNYNGR